MIANDLWFLENYSQARSFRCVKILTLASQVRVAMSENIAEGGLQVWKRDKELSHLMSNSDYMDRRYAWKAWYANSHTRMLAAALQTFEADVTPTSALLAVTSPLQEGKSSIQRVATKAIIASQKPSAEERVRDKLARWNLHGFPGPNARRILRRLRELQSLVAPRVSAACFSMIWNRWTTARLSNRDMRPVIVACWDAHARQRTVSSNTSTVGLSVSLAAQASV